MRSNKKLITVAHGLSSSLKSAVANGYRMMVKAIFQLSFPMLLLMEGTGCGHVTIANLALCVIINFN